MNKKPIFVYIILPIVACFAMYFFEQVLKFNYFFKSLAKVIIFTLLPLLSRILIKPSKQNKNNKKLPQKILPGLIFSVSVLIIISLGYVIIQNFIDPLNILTDMKDKLQINKSNYILVALYITFCNSFLEEFFFRKFAFMDFYQAGYKRLSFISSSLLFAIYHISIFNTWFTTYIMLLMLLGLTLAGLFFNFINIKTATMLNSWIIHISANIVITSIGYFWIIKY